mmetsp:Transcript_67348/g.119069  ORF Transcript_67348/g.119069 Transcript_67348/m.119069 type:complete len:254 (+) Transcript_67348:243-1004(+)
MIGALGHTVRAAVGMDTRAANGLLVYKLPMAVHRVKALMRSTAAATTLNAPSIVNMLNGETGLTVRLPATVALASGASRLRSKTTPLEGLVIKVMDFSQRTAIRSLALRAANGRIGQSGQVAQRLADVVPKRKREKSQTQERLMVQSVKALPRRVRTATRRPVPRTAKWQTGSNGVHAPAAVGTARRSAGDPYWSKRRQTVSRALVDSRRTQRAAHLTARSTVAGKIGPNGLPAASHVAAVAAPRNMRRASER